ncbi:MAG: carboxypeptidase-like regulatory domain-containing protein, partial [Fidelibacterota bacterium]
MKRIFSILCLSTILFGGNTGKITGKVTDKATGDPLIGVNIMLEGTTIGTATDQNGNYLILNITPDVYTMTANMIGYATLINKEVKVIADLTTTIDMELVTAALPGQQVEVVATKPAVRMDQTSSTQTYSGDEMLNLPVQDVESAVALAAGAVEENGVLHLRGGRAQETVYLFDGIALKDPLTGNANDSNVPMLGVGEMSVITGGFSAEYGDAQSGVI